MNRDAQELIKFFDQRGLVLGPATQSEIARFGEESTHSQLDSNKRDVYQGFYKHIQICGRSGKTISLIEEHLANEAVRLMRQAGEADVTASGMIIESEIPRDKAYEAAAIKNKDMPSVGRHSVCRPFNRFPGQFERHSKDPIDASGTFRLSYGELLIDFETRRENQCIPSSFPLLYRIRPRRRVSSRIMPGVMVSL
jgi:uncharacterized membrane-anchored protein YhcB (DUF1043 family)